MLNEDGRAVATSRRSTSLRRDFGLLSENAGLRGKWKLRALPLVEPARLGPLGVLAAVSGYAENRGSSGVPRGIASGAGRGRSAGVDVPDGEGE